MYFVTISYSASDIVVVVVVVRIISLGSRHERWANGPAAHNALDALLLLALLFTLLLAFLSAEALLPA